MSNISVKKVRVPHVSLSTVKAPKAGKKPSTKRVQGSDTRTEVYPDAETQYVSHSNRVHKVRLQPGHASTYKKSLTAKQKAADAKLSAELKARYSYSAAAKAAYGRYERYVEYYG